jgi:hypothetical protein
MKNPAHRPQWMIVLTSVLVAVMPVASGGTFPALFADPRPALAGQTLSASGVPAIHGIVDAARNPDLRWPDFTPYKTEVTKLYQTNGYSLLWGAAVVNALVFDPMPNMVCSSTAVASPSFLTP